MNADDIRRKLREGDPDITRRMREGDSDLARCLRGELAEVPDAGAPERRKSKAGRRKAHPRGGRRGAR